MKHHLKKISSFLLLICLLLLNLYVHSQTQANRNQFALAYNPSDAFNFQGNNVAHYGIGWHDELTLGPLGYLSGYFGLRFFTGGEARMNVRWTGNVGIGIENANYRLNVAQDISMNEDIDIAQLGLSGKSDPAKRLVMGYDVNGAGFGFIKSGWYQHQWTNLSLQPNGGNVGIGITAPNYKINVAQDISMNEDIDIAQLGISGKSDPSKRLVIGYDVNGAGFGFIKSGWYQHQWTNLSLQPNGGNVGIGTTMPKEKLSVNGNIRSKEVKVEATNWPDYVFEQDYQMESLDNLKKYIVVYKHLPEVPSAKEVDQQGIALGEMNKILLKKIEELTLHLIQKDEEVKVLQQQVGKLIKFMEPQKSIK